MEIDWMEIFWEAMFCLLVTGLLAFVLGYFLKIGMNRKYKK